MMKRLAIIALIISTLSPVFCRAESVSITHVFEDMKGTTLTWSGTPTDYTIGYTDLVTYTGSGGGTFGVDDFMQICVSLPTSSSVMQLSMIEGLERIMFYHILGSAPSNIKVYISTDNSSWTDISASAVYNTSYIDAPMPAKGNYYVKIANTTSTGVKFLSFKYYYDPPTCNCFPYIAP